jgi:nucleolar protein 4
VQIPLFVSERGLRRLATHAVKQFEKEVQAGTRNGLTADELIVIEDEPSPEGPSSSNQKKPTKTRGLRQTKIIRYQDRVDAITGKGKSKGYGFVEMHSHADALRVLRWANNKPDVHGLMREWWVGELNELVAAEKAKLKKAGGDSEDAKDIQARLKRVEGELGTVKDGSGKKKSGQNLIIEFSIENVQVVRRRAEFERGHKKVCFLFSGKDRK